MASQQIQISLHSYFLEYGEILRVSVTPPTSTFICQAKDAAMVAQPQQLQHQMCAKLVISQLSIIIILSAIIVLINSMDVSDALSMVVILAVPL